MNNLLLIGAILGSFALYGCGNSSSGGGQNSDPNRSGVGYATTPQPCNTQNQNQWSHHQVVQCQNHWYNSWNPNQIQWHHGAWYWPYQYQASGSNCGCPSGYYPVSAQTFGVACAPVAYFNSNIVYYNVGWGGMSYWNFPQNGGWINTPQAYYQSPTQSSCEQTTAQGCDVRLNTCPSGSTCRPVAGGSTIGLCVK